MPFVTRSVNEVDKEKTPRLPGISIPFSRTLGEFTTHVLVRPPMTVGVSFKTKKKLNDGRWSKKPSSIDRYRIKVPWQAFMVRMNRAGAITDTFMWFMLNEPKDLSERVYMPPLPNIYPSGHICNGTIRLDFNDPPYLKVYKAFEAFWTTPFTEETWPEWKELVPKCFSFCGAGLQITYGYLKYIFEYWQEHDKKHHVNRWTEANGKCFGASSEFPFGVFKIHNADHSEYSRYVATLDDAIRYALTFLPMKRID